MPFSKRGVRESMCVHGAGDSRLARQDSLESKNVVQDVADLHTSFVSGQPPYQEPNTAPALEPLQDFVLRRDAFHLNTASFGSSALDFTAQETPSDMATLSSSPRSMRLTHIDYNDEHPWAAQVPTEDVPDVEEQMSDEWESIHRSFHFVVSSPSPRRSANNEPSPSRFHDSIPFPSSSDPDTKVSSPKPQSLISPISSSPQKTGGFRTRLHKLHPKRALEVLRKPRGEDDDRFARQNVRWKHKFEQQDALLRQVSHLRDRLISPLTSPATPHFPQEHLTRHHGNDDPESVEEISQARRNAPLPPLPDFEKAAHQLKSQQIGKSPASDSRPGVSQSAKESKAIEMWEVTQRTLVKVRLPAKRGSQFKVGGILGMGAFGTVFLVYHVAKRTEVAMKCIKYTQGFSKGSCRGVVNELKVMGALATQKIQSRFLLRPYLGYDLWAWRSSKGYVHILTEYCPGGHLANYVMAISREMLPLVVGEIALGLEHLHDSGIVHHDIKPDNILVDMEGHCVITDFGGARFLRNGRPDWTLDERPTHTPDYTAPELLLLEDYDASVDYWSLGVTIAELLVGKEGVLQGRYVTLFEDLANIRRALEDSAESLVLIDLIFQLLEPLATQRLKGPAVRSHEYFAVLEDEWMAIRTGKLPPFKFEVGTTHPPVYGRGYSISQPKSINGPGRHDLLEMMQESGLELECHNEFDVAAQLRELSNPLN